MKSKRNNSIVRLFSFTQKEVFSNSNNISIKRVNNRTINDDVLVFNAVLLSSYDVIDDSLIDSSNGLLGYYNNSLCLTMATISISAVLSSAGINISQAISMTLELEGSISPFYGYIDIYDSNGDYFDTIDCTDGHNPLEIDIKAIYEQSGSASFALIPIEPCSGVTLFNPANAQIRLTYHPLDLSYFSSVGYVNQQLFDKYKEFLPISVKDYSFKIDKSFGLPYIDKTLFFLKGKHLPIFLQLKFIYPHHFDGFNSFGGFPLGYKTNYHCYLYHDSGFNQYIYEDKDGFVHVFQLAENSCSLWFDNSGTGLMLEFRNFLPVIFDEEGNYQAFDYLGRLFTIHKTITDTHFAELKINYIDDTFKISTITDSYNRTINFVYSSSTVTIFYKNNLVAFLNSIDNELRNIVKYSNNQEADTLYYGTTSTYVFSNMLSFALSSGEVVALHFNKYNPSTGNSPSIYQYDSLNRIITNIKGRTYDFSYEIEDYQIKEITITDNKSIKTTFSKNNDQTVTSGYDNQTKLPIISVKYKNASYLIKEDFPVNQSLRLDLTNNVSSNSNPVYSTLMPPNSSYQTVTSSSSYLQKNINYMFYVELNSHEKLNDSLIVNLFEENYQTSGFFHRASLIFNNNETIHVFPVSKKGNMPSRFYLVISNNSNQTLFIKRANIVPLLGEFNALCSNINHGGPVFYKDEQGHAFLNGGMGLTFIPPRNTPNSYLVCESDYLANERNFYKKASNSFNFWVNDKKHLVANITSASVKLSNSLNLVYSDSTIHCVDNYNDSFDAHFRFIHGKSDNSFVATNISHNSDSNYDGFYYEKETESSIGGYDSITFYDYDKYYLLKEYWDNECHNEEYTYDNHGNLLVSFAYIDNSNSYNVRKDYAYDNYDNLTWERDFVGDSVPQHWLYYDIDNNLNEESLPSGLTLKYIYSSNLDKIIGIDFCKDTQEHFSQSLTYQYNRLKEQKTDNTIYSYVYNEDGEVSSVSGNNQTIVTFSYSYTSTNDTKTITFANGYSFGEVYDRFGRLITNDKLSYTYNSYSLVSQINDATYINSSFNISYSYNYWNQLTSINNLYNSLSFDVSYDDYLRRNTDSFNYQNNVIYQNTYSYHQQIGLEKEIKSTTINLVNLSTSISIDENIDSLSRVINQSLLINSSGIKKEFSYYNYSYLGGGTTNSVHSVSYKNITSTGNSEYLLETYEYSLSGDIKKITSLENNVTSFRRYIYDNYSRLFREDNEQLDRTYVYLYDNDGNIIEKKEYHYCQGPASSSSYIKTYQYIYDSTYPNRLTSFDNESITYDNLGNPLTYRGATLSWSRGTLLSSYIKNGLSINIAYDGFGFLKSKTIGTSITSYNFINGLLLLETRGTSFITYLYSNKDIIGFACGNDIYYYEKNTQNDVVAIRDINHNVVARYLYDAWGNHKVLNPNGTEHDITDNVFIGNINPIRYRSYYYDTDLKMYWLTTRYYDSEVGRFISPDHYSYLDYQKLHGLNLYAYSKNNPVMYHDLSGHSAWVNFWKCLGNWFKDTFGGFVDYTKKVIGFRDDYFFFGHETGIKINVPTSNNEKPIYFFASSADEWWKFWEYQIGIRINIGKTYFAYSFGFGEANFSFGSENSSVNIQMGINKYSVEFSGEKDGVVSYNQFYIRTIPTAALVLACMYAPYTVPVAAALIFGC